MAIRRFSWLTGLVFFAAVIAGTEPAEAQQRAPASNQVWRVIERAPGTAVAADGQLGDAVVIRFDLLADAARSGGLVEVPLTGGLTVTAEVRWTSGADTSQTFVAGPLVGQDGEVSLTVFNGTMSGRIVVGDRLFLIRRVPNSALHVATEVDRQTFPQERQPRVVPAPVPGARLPAPAASDAVGDTNQFVDLLVVYTPAARTQQGGTAMIQADLVGAVNNANTALENANVVHRFRLASPAPLEVAYTEFPGDIGTDLTRLTSTSDGHLDTVHTLRNTYTADVVTLVTDSTDASCGIGWLMGPTNINNGFQVNAFNVVEATCANGNLTLAHEIGHNMGLHHDFGNAGGQSPAFPYAYGYGVDGVGRTVMAYTCPGGSCTRRAIFSTPLHNFPPAFTTPAGTASADNARALDGTSLTVANFRQAGTCSYSLTPTSATFPQAGGPGSFTVTTGGSCAWTVTNNNPSFLTVTGGSSGTGNGTVSYTVAANGGALRTGTFNVDSQTFTVTQGPTMTTDRTTLSYGAVNAGGTLANQTSSQIVRVSFSSGSPSWTATPSAPWIQITGGAGTGAGQFTVAVVGHASLPPTGTVTSSVLVTSAGATNSPRTITVRLTLFANTTTTAAPLGSFDTPIDLSAGLQGSIAVTGWALDDTEVTRVEIWRDLAPGETTPPFGGGGLADGKVFIGQSLFVNGARPDVEAAHPTTPLAYRAGWGYLMLTWGLWAQGNGSYTLYAFAYDNDGHATSLGSKTISVSNATANKPFGAIDTPGYGGTASGASFINFGWALTPPANVVDPRNCVIANGNVLVSVDSGPLLPVVYGSNRPDIQAGFPGFSNSTNAGGAYTLNAAALPNGVHTIGWLATDSCGRTDGMGSRFFTVTGSATDAPSTTTAALAATSAAGAVAAADAGVSGEPVSVRSNLDASRLVYANGAGMRVVEVAQGDRIEVEVGARRAGRHVVNGQRRRLPVGSSYDADSGTFYWQPAAGFLGSFDLEFAPVSAGSGLRVADADRRDAGAALRDDMRDRASERGNAGVVNLRVVVGPPMRMAIDTPRSGEVVDRAFTVAGWALDLAAAEGAGVDTLHVWAYPVAGGPPVFLGVPAVGGARPDVGATYGPTFVPSAYDLQTTTLGPGEYDVVVYVHRALTNAFDAAQVVRVTVR